MEEIVQKLDELIKVVNSNSVLDWIAALAYYFDCDYNYTVYFTSQRQ